MIDGARQHEQQIRQPIDVRDQVRLDAVRAERHDRSLRATAHGPREMQQRARAIAAGQNKAAQRRQLGLETIDPVFEALNVGIGHGRLAHPLRDFFGGIGKARAYREQILLQVLEEAGHIAGDLALRAHDSKTGIELVHVPIGGHARIGLRDAGSAEQPVPPVSPVRV